MSGIFWLASFPKSGNTWVRAFLTYLTRTEGDNKPVDINCLSTGPIGSSRTWVQDALGFEINELTHAEIDALRPRAYQWIAEHGKTGYHKIHDAYTCLQDGTPLISKSATKGVVYLARNPFDVAVSYANHAQIELDKSIEDICSSDLAFCDPNKAQGTQLRQVLRSWSEHVTSWLEADVHRLFVRYEDLRKDSFATFLRIVQFLQIDASEQQIRRAIDAASFEKLKAQEQEKGFGERLSADMRFFRRGVVGDWQSKLNEAQIAQIIDVHGEVMQQLGYLDANGNPSELTKGCAEATD